MSLFSYDSLNNTYLNRMESYDYLAESSTMKTTNSIAMDSLSQDTFDIFLSHSYRDKKIIPALKKELENMGFSVYVDWINDKFLSRNEVNKKTAAILQTRMNQSKCLIYATSDNTKTSRWMPWELGYFDGIKNKMVGILPIKAKDNNFTNDFHGEEYLSLYYYIDKAPTKTSDKEVLWVNESKSKFVNFSAWLNGSKPSER